MRSRSLLALLPLFAGVAVGQTSATDLAKQLKSKESADRIRAANELGKLGAGAAGAANALAAALGDEVPEVRNAAADALGQTGITAIVHVGRALADRDRQAAAARAAGRLGKPAAELVPALIKCLRVDDMETTDAVTKAIASIGEPGLPHVIKGLEDHAINSKLCVAVRTMGPTAKPAVPALLQLVAKRGVRGREGAAEALGAIGDPRAVPVLIDVVDSGLSKIDTLLHSATEKSLRSLIEIKAEPDRVVPLCLRVLAIPRRDPDAVRLQQFALEGLERFDAKQPEVLAALRTFVAADPGENKAAAERTLKKLGG